MKERTYRAFISYSHRDAVWAKWLHRSLERYRVPRQLVRAQTPVGPAPRRLTPIFRDIDELPTSSDLSESVESALRRSQCLIVVCSPNAVQSRWVDVEIQRFKEFHGEDGEKRIFAVVVGAPKGSSPDAPLDLATVFPKSLRYRVGPDGNITDKPAEPLAADLRRSRDGKKHGLLKIIAGLIGVDLGDLTRRDHHRRQSRLQVAAGGMAAGLAITGGLTWLAYDARNEAQRQRTEAEGLVEFMLTDLRDRLDAVGRLDALESTGERALDYYAAQDPHKMDADSLGRRARAQLLVGEIAYRRGDLEAALTAYLEAAATTEEQLARDPKNPERMFDHAQSVFYVGTVAWRRSDAATAEANFLKYLALAQQMVATGPDNLKWQAELGYAYNNLGSIYFGLKRWLEAEEAFSKAIDVRTNITERASDSQNNKINLANSYSWLASVQNAQGKFDLAESSRLTEIEIYQSILQTDEQNQKVTRRLSIAYASITSIMLSTGNIEKALDFADNARRLIDDALKRNALDIRWKYQATNIYNRLAEIYRAQARQSDAIVAARKSLSYAEDLWDRDPSIEKWHVAYVRALTHLVRIEQSDGPLSGNLNTLIETLHHVRAIFDQKYVEASSSSTIAAAYLMSGMLHTDDPEVAQQMWETGFSYLYQPLDAETPFGKSTAAQLLIALERKEQAIDLIESLNEMGYRHPDFIDFTKKIDQM